MKNKKTLRKKLKSTLKDITNIQEKNENIFLKLINNEKILESKSLLIYINANHEVETRVFIEWAWQNNKKVFLPFINEQIVGLVESWNDIEQYKNTNYSQPKLPTITYNLDLAIIPGLAFTLDGSRLGQGYGWYDKFLSNHPDVYKIGVCYKEQLVANIEQEPHDIKMNEIIYA